MTGSETYDALTYPSWSYPETHPATVEAMATGLGLTPPPISTARVLELGCAVGGNIVPMACALPQATFAGIDYSPTQIDLAKKFASAVGASNLELTKMSIADVTPELGKFDYIIAHGIFSWVPQGIRDALLRVCRENLSEHGIAYVSFNTYPGWHALQWLRGLAFLHAPPDDRHNPRERARRAREAIDAVLASRRFAGFPIGAVFQRILSLYDAGDESNWFHDIMEETNEPFYFNDFIAMTSAQGLQYVADMNHNPWLAEEIAGPRAMGLLESAGDDWLRREQYLDYMRNQTFRRALLTHAGHNVHRQPDPQRFARLFVMSALQPQTGTHTLAAPGTVVNFMLHDQAQLTSEIPLTKLALTLLGSSFPKPYRVDDLLEQAAKSLKMVPADFSQAKREAAEELIKAWGNGLVDAYVTPPLAKTEISERPEVWRVARHQAAAGSKTLTSLRHELVPTTSLNRVSLKMIALLDGTRTREQVVSEIAETAAREITSPNFDHAAFAAAMQDALATLLKDLARKELLWA